MTMAANYSKCCPKPGEWIRGKLVGSGSFGAVQLAMNKSGALFVVKSAQSEIGYRCLENESNLLERFDSPYIILCLGKEFAKGRNGEIRKLNLFMECMSGGSLSDIADKFGGVSVEDVIRSYTGEILHGLKYLHENGIVHCDLKCKNLLLGAYGNVKLADFGCAKRLDGSSTISPCSWESIGGTPLWMAPEVLRNEGVSFASDIWSLGCTVVEMATGTAPWKVEETSNAMSTVLKIACSNAMPQLPSHLSEEGLDFLSKCFERNPQRRWTASELLRHPFVAAEKSCVEDCAWSPSSVLNIGDIDEDDGYESDEFAGRIPFSLRCSGNQTRVKWEQNSSESWITVRSG